MVTKKLNLSSLTETQLKIVEYLIQGIYASEIADKLDIDKSTVSRFVKRLSESGYIEPSRRDPLNNKAVVYNIAIELRRIIEPNYIEIQKESLCEIHKLRFKAKFIEKSGEIATDIKRFAHAEFRFIKSFSPKGDTRYIFEKNGIYGRYKIICYNNSLEVVQVDREHVAGKDLYEKENKLAIDLAESAKRFVEEQGWCGCRIKLGELSRVGKYDIAIKSKKAQQIVDSGENTYSVMGIGIDNSLKGENGEAEVEGNEPTTMNEFDFGIRGAIELRKHNTVDKVNYIYSDTKSKEQALNSKLLEINNNVMAVCQSGMTRDQQFAQLTVIVADMARTLANHSDSLINHDEILLKMATNTEKIVKLLEEKSNQ